MSGFAAITGEADGPPTLPPFGLADSIAALSTAYAVMAALRSRDRTGRGQVVDMAIIEPMLTVLGPQPTLVRPARPRAGPHRQPVRQQRPPQHLSHGRRRAGSRSPPRRSPSPSGSCAWSAAPSSSTSRGSPPAPAAPQHADELDEAVGGWIARHGRDEVVAAFEQAEAAVAPVYDIRGRDGRRAVPGARLDHGGRGRGAGHRPHAERPLPALRDPRRRSDGRAVRTARTPTAVLDRTRPGEREIAELRDGGAL